MGMDDEPGNVYFPAAWHTPGSLEQVQAHVDQHDLDPFDGPEAAALHDPNSVWVNTATGEVLDALPELATVDNSRIWQAATPPPPPKATFDLELWANIFAGFITAAVVFRVLLGG